MCVVYLQCSEFVKELHVYFDCKLNTFFFFQVDSRYQYEPHLEALPHTAPTPAGSGHLAEPYRRGYQSQPRDVTQGRYKNYSRPRRQYL